MTEFLQLTLPDYSLNDDATKVTQDNLCICCLSKNVSLINLTNCKHLHIFDVLLDIKIQMHDNFICYSCHNILKKLEDFKIQVQQSINILTNNATSIKTLKPHQNLIFSQIEINSTINSEPIQFQVKDNSNKTLDLKLECETEIKIEHESSDFEDIPLVEIKNKRYKKIKENRTLLQKKYDGKIKITVLSMEEMLADRKQEALKKSFVNLPYKCEYCITAFDHELTYKDHMEKRHEKKNGGYTCKICKSILSTKSSYDEHYKRHFRRYECIECGKRNNNVYSVLKHYNENHGKIGTQFACNLCDFTTESHRVYRYHQEKHRKAKVECDKCGNTFVNNNGLRNHMFTVHGQSSRVYSCDQCGKIYRAKSGLTAHLAKHAPSTPAYCVPCDTHFRNEIGLKHHLKTHSKHISDSDKRFVCNECGAKFLLKSYLQEHIDWTHLNKSKHACNKCPKVFKNKSCLNKHRDFVHEKKRLPRNKICDYCGRGFTPAPHSREVLAGNLGKNLSDNLDENFFGYTLARFLIQFSRSMTMDAEVTAAISLLLCEFAYYNYAYIKDKKQTRTTVLIGESLATEKHASVESIQVLSLSILQAHVRTHTGERPLRCARCAAAFAHPAALYTHGKLVHGK
ncbi:unnamed protein product, partial [Brenthis ino]